VTISTRSAESTWAPAQAGERHDASAREAAQAIAHTENGVRFIFIVANLACGSAVRLVGEAYGEFCTRDTLGDRFFLT
jgi:hypothetical protein